MRKREYFHFISFPVSPGSWVGASICSFSSGAALFPKPVCPCVNLKEELWFFWNIDSGWICLLWREKTSSAPMAAFPIFCKQNPHVQSHTLFQICICSLYLFIYTGRDPLRQHAVLAESNYSLIVVLTTMAGLKRWFWWKQIWNTSEKAVCLLRNSSPWTVRSSSLASFCRNWKRTKLSNIFLCDWRRAGNIYAMFLSRGNQNPH